MVALARARRGGGDALCAGARVPGVPHPRAPDEPLRGRRRGRGGVPSGARRRRPEIAPSILRKPAVLQISHAIEDEYLARATSGLVFGSFQRERFYRASERRWRELARTAELAVAVADFAAVRRPSAAPSEVPLELSQPLAREWTLIIDAPGARACLAAWEQPRQEHVPDRERRFETLWSFEPEVVRTSAEVCAELLWKLAPEIARRLPGPEADAALGADELRFASALAQRIVGYLAARVA